MCRVGHKRAGNQQVSKLKRGTLINLSGVHVIQLLEDGGSTGHIRWMENGREYIKRLDPKSNVQVVQECPGIPAGMVSRSDGAYDTSDGNTFDPDYFAGGMNGYAGDFSYGD